jgi:hypothetical protein
MRACNIGRKFAEYDQFAKSKSEAYQNFMIVYKWHRVIKNAIIPSRV